MPIQYTYPGYTYLTATVLKHGTIEVQYGYHGSTQVFVAGFTCTVYTEENCTITYPTGVFTGSVTISAVPVAAGTSEIICFNYFYVGKESDSASNPTLVKWTYSHNNTSSGPSTSVTPTTNIWVSCSYSKYTIGTTSISGTRNSSVTKTLHELASSFPSSRSLVGKTVRIVGSVGITNFDKTITWSDSTTDVKIESFVLGVGSKRTTTTLYKTGTAGLKVTCSGVGTGTATITSITIY